LVEKMISQLDSTYFRPTELDTLLGDPSKTTEPLGWVSKIILAEPVREMAVNDLEQARRLAALKGSRLSVAVAHE
jgi:GDPmannose 4,6-dehydratase